MFFNKEILVVTNSHQLLKQIIQHRKGLKKAYSIS